jgi:dTDP-4-dehydrorhamnose reductase
VVHILKLFITGASGLLGRSLVPTALKAGHKVYSGYNRHPPSEGTPCKVDLMDKSNLAKSVNAISPDCVIHAAANTDVDYCEANPDFALQINGAATGVLVRACRKAGSHFVYLSTDYVFDGERGQYVEQDETNPINAYGRSKLTGELETKQAGEDWCIIRTALLYGWDRHLRPNFADWLIDRLRAQLECRVVTDQYGSPTLVSNLAKMVTEVAETKYKGLLHLAGATRIDRYDFALRIARKFDLDHRLIVPIRSSDMGWRAKRPSDSSLVVQKAIQLLSNKPIPVEQALDQFAHEVAKQ